MKQNKKWILLFGVLLLILIIYLSIYPTSQVVRDNVDDFFESNPILKELYGKSNINVCPMPSKEYDKADLSEVIRYKVSKNPFDSLYFKVNHDEKSSLQEFIEYATPKSQNLFASKPYESMNYNMDNYYKAHHIINDMPPPISYASMSAPVNITQQPPPPPPPRPPPQPPRSAPKPRPPSSSSVVRFSNAEGFY